jgi:putative peptide zinc metalloprotease protein
MGAPTQSKTDLMYEILYDPKFTPTPSPSVKVKTVIVDGKPSYVMKNHANGTYYDLDELTNLIWNLTDGKRTVKQIVKETQREKPHVQERTILGTLLFLAESNLLLASVEQTPKKRFRVVSAFEVNLGLVKRSNDFLQSLNKRVQPLFKKSLLWAATVFIVVGFVWFLGDFVSIYGKKANFEILGSSVVGFFFYNFVALGPVIAIHEIAHGLALVHYGGQPGEMGTGLFYFSPIFYIETTDAWGLKRGERMMVYLAGNISTLTIGSALAIIHFTVPIPQPASHILTMAAFYCFIISLFNFAPPFETDGYYILTDIVNMPNLRRDSYGYLGSVFRRAFRRPVKTRIQGLTRQKKRILLVYAVASAGWILYIVFQSSLFLVYMAQDTVMSLTSIFQTVLSSQALSASVVIIAVASTFYFGMQVAGYGYLFSAAMKKATAKPLQVEAIHDRDLAVFAYLPPQAPESLSNSLRRKMENAAKKFTPNFEVKQIGRSCIAVLRMGGIDLALVQIKEHLKTVENEFSSAYRRFITTNREALQNTVGIHAPHKNKLTTMLDQIATESAATGNSTARSLIKNYKEKQNETLLYLLSAAYGTVWTIELQPALEYDVERDLCPSLLLEDLTSTDLYGDAENFKKRFVYGFDSLAKLAEEMDAGVHECLANPDTYQVVSTLEPIKSRIVFIGRTENIEKSIDTLAPLFLAQTWSGYLDNLLSETCFALSTVNRADLPTAKETKEISIGELAVLRKHLSTFMENQETVEKCLDDSETSLTKSNHYLAHLRTAFESSKTSKVGMLDAIFHVNVENFENLPNRITECRREWKTICKRIEKVKEHVEKEYTSRKPVIAAKKRKMLLAYPFVATLTIALLVLSFQTTVLTWQLSLVSAASFSQALYWLIQYRARKSFCSVAKYPSRAFEKAQLFILALTEAIYGYATTEDVLTPF